MFYSTKQVLLTGCYRTGTEYLSLLLGNSPHLTSFMYTTNFMRYYYQKFDPIEDNYSSLIKEAAQTIKERWGKEVDTKCIIDHCDQLETVRYGNVYDAIVNDLYLKNNPTKHWVEKNQLVWRQIPDFLDEFPHSKAIILVRDPRNVLASFKKITNAPRPLYLGAIFNCLDSMQFALSLKKKYNDQIHYLKFENLLNQTEEQLKIIFNFLELPFNFNWQDTSHWTDTRGEPWGHNSGFMKKGVNATFDKNLSTKRWQTNLEPWEIEFCEAINENMMNEFEYDLLNLDSSSRPQTFKDRPEFQHEKIQEYYNHWQETKSGIQAFPSNPLDKKNWSTGKIGT